MLANAAQPGSSLRAGSGGLERSFEYTSLRVLASRRAALIGPPG
eukprot:SAG31_NODE_40292_length_281_cov_1.412088_1_plen_43_part_10